MRVGIAIEDTWDFFHEIYADLSTHHQTSLYQRRSLSLPIVAGRLNGLLHRQSMHRFMRANSVVMFEWASGLLALASQLPKACGIVTRLHRYELYQWADRINWDAVDSIILVSEMKRREFLARFPAQASKLVVIPEAISLDRFQLKPKTFRGDIGIMCHLRPRKRVYDLILSFYELLKREPKLHLHIAGGKVAGVDEYEHALRSLVQRLGIESKVTFYGHVDKPEAWYRNIDIFISNSYSEGLQVSPLEAIASGCYALSHQWEGADELFPAENLFFSSQEMNEKILRYCGQTETERRIEILRHAAAVRDRFNVAKTKTLIRQQIESAGASYSR